jgi:hypothetical protein
MSYVPVNEETLVMMIKLGKREKRPVSILFCGECFNGCKDFEIKDGIMYCKHPYTGVILGIPTDYIYSISINSVIVITIDLNNTLQG